MTIDRDYNCPLCGLPCRTWPLVFVPDGDADEREVTKELSDKLLEAINWLNNVTMLCDPDDEVGQLVPNMAYDELPSGWVPSFKSEGMTPEKLEELSRARKPIEIRKGAIHDTWGYFDLEDPDGRVNVDHYCCNSTSDGKVYVPIHDRCLDIVHIVMSTPSSNAYIRDLRGLWTAIRWRVGLAARFELNALQANFRPALRGWYLPPWLVSEWGEYREAKGKVGWTGPTKSPSFNLHWTCYPDPWEVEDVTGFVLSNLREYRPSEVCLSDGDKAFAKGVAALPEDLFDDILHQFRHARDFPSSQSAHVLPQTFWMNELMQGSQGLLPWLWDIDPARIEAKAKEPCPGGEDYEWDWELLVRKLTRRVDAGLRLDVPEDPDSYHSTGVETMWTWTGYTDCFSNVPLGLHNRRRIWQLCEEMYVGDSLPLADCVTLHSDYKVPPTRKGAENFWTKSGALRRDGPVWLPVVRRGEFARKVDGRVFRIPKRS